MTHAKVLPLSLKFAVATSLALVFASAPAAAVTNTTFAQFLQTARTKVVHYGAPGGGNTLTVTDAPTTFVTLAFGPTGTYSALMNLSASSTGTFVPDGGGFVQPFWNGSVSFTNGTTNLLTMNFQNAIFNADDGLSSGGLISAFPPHIINYTSDILDVAGLSTKDFSLGFTGFSPHLVIDGNGFGEAFEANVVGSFAGAVPEPGVWATMIAGFGLVGAMTRRQRRRQVYVTA